MVLGPWAAQLGILAAFVVLFVPMALAGYHLSRNKVLFFSGALFISLAVTVHLAPYFPQLLLTPQFPTPQLSQSPFNCLPFLHHILWDRFSTTPRVSFRFAPSPPQFSCNFQKLSRPDASLLLNGSSILIAGDSQARLFTLALLRLIADSQSLELIEPQLFKRHSNYRADLPELGIQVDFIWAPYENNLTEAVREFESSSNFPDVVVTGSGLWHMLHFTNSTDYGEGLREVGRAVEGIGVRRRPHLFWLGLPVLVNSMLNSEEKREKMSLAVWERYDLETKRSGILRSSGGPFLVLDVGILSRGCGVECTVDGMHYDGVVYEAALHVMLNALLIESQQRI